MAHASKVMTLTYNMANTSSMTAMSHFWCVMLYGICPQCTEKSQVDGFLFCVHRYLFSHDSLYFSTRFTQLGVRDHEALSTVVSLGDVECEDFEAFLSVLYPQ